MAGLCAAASVATAQTLPIQDGSSEDEVKVNAVDASGPIEQGTEPTFPGTTSASIAPESTATTPTAPAVAARDTDIAPLNFCGLGPKDSHGAFQRQRVVMLDVGVDPSMTGSREVEHIRVGKETKSVPRSIFRAPGLHPGQHAREVFMTVFPMKRLYMVLASATPGSAFDDKKPISMATAQQVLATDPHAAYSAGCADWLVAPYATRGDVTWQKVTKKKTVRDENGKKREVPYTAWSLSVNVATRMEVYKRSENGFVHYATLKGAPRGTAADDSLPWGSPETVHETVSVGLPANCPLPTGTASKAPDAFARCGGSWLNFAPEGRSPTHGGFVDGSHYCQGLSDDVSAGEANMRAMALCELRHQMEYAAVDLQLHGKQMCGWRLFSPLLDAPNGKDRGITMGEHEGAERGDYYLAYGDSGSDGCGDSSDEQGWARISSVGPGSEAGFENLSIVHFQAGNPASGVRMEEYALHGLRFALRPTFGMLLAVGDLDSGVAFGGEFQASYDLTRFIPLWDEFWFDVHAGILVGSDSYIPLGLGVESAKYLGDRWSVVAGAGFALTGVGHTVSVGAAYVNASGTPTTVSEDTAVSGISMGMYLRGGLNYALRPNWHVRGILEVRSGFGSATLENKTELPGYELDGGPLLSTLLSASLSYTY